MEFEIIIGLIERYFTLEQCKMLTIIIYDAMEKYESSWSNEEEKYKLMYSEAVELSLDVLNTSNAVFLNNDIEFIKDLIILMLMYYWNVIQYWCENIKNSK